MPRSVYARVGRASVPTVLSAACLLFGASAAWADGEGVAAAAAPSAAPEARIRVYVANVEPGANVQLAEAQTITDTVVAEMRRFASSYEVLAARELRNVLDNAAQQQALGCDTVSCASEVADALNAPQLITGSVAHVGDTWLLTLSRIDRAHMTALGRAQVQARGAAPDSLLAAVPHAVAEVMGQTSGGAPGVLLPVGLVGVGVGALAMGGGGWAWFSAGQIFIAGKTALAEGKPDIAAKRRAEGEPLYWLGVAGVAAGAVCLGAGAVGAGAAVWGGAE